MTALLENIITRIRVYTKSEKFKKKYRLKNIVYKNDRKIRVSTAFFFVLCGLKTSFGFELGPLIKENSELRFGSLTMLRARSKLSCDAFGDLIPAITKEFLPRHLWKKYQVLSLDGMEVTLSHLISVNKRFYVMAMYDFFNDYFVCAAFLPSINDRYMEAVSMIEKADLSHPQLFLFDKGFHSILLLRKLMESGKKYVILTSKSFLKEVNEFRTSKKTDSTLFIHYSKRRAHDAKLKHDMPLPYDFELRCVKLQQRKKEPEIIITNLSQQEASMEDLKELFHICWDSKKKSPHLKQEINEEIFEGVSENNIKQDYYASLLLYNLYLTENGAIH